jgi:hypothetical protein
VLGNPNTDKAIGNSDHVNTLVHANPDTTRVTSVNTGADCDKSSAMLCVTVEKGKLRANTLTSILLAIGGIAGAATVAILSYLVYMRCCAIKRDNMNMMELNY